VDEEVGLAAVERVVVAVAPAGSALECADPLAARGRLMRVVLHGTADAARSAMLGIGRELRADRIVGGAAHRLAGLADALGDAEHVAADLFGAARDPAATAVVRILRSRSDIDLAPIRVGRVQVLVAVEPRSDVFVDAAQLTTLPGDASVLRVRRRYGAIRRNAAVVAAATVGIARRRIDAAPVAVDHSRRTAAHALPALDTRRALVPALAAVLRVVEDEGLAAVFEATIAVLECRASAFGLARAVHATRGHPERVEARTDVSACTAVFVVAEKVVLALVDRHRRLAAPPARGARGVGIRALRPRAEEARGRRLRGVSAIRIGREARREARVHLGSHSHVERRLGASTCESDADDESGRDDQERPASKSEHEDLRET